LTVQENFCNFGGETRIVEFAMEMRTIRRVAMTGLMAVAMAAMGSNGVVSANDANAAGKQMDNILIIDGLFFDETPVASADITGMGRIRTAAGTQAMLITLATPLPEAALKYALPNC
jgi:hypothetical protein